MNNKIYVPFFGDHEVQKHNYKILGVNNYDELVSLLSDKNITDEEEYCKLIKMYTTMVSGDMIPTLEGYHPEIKKNFFQIPQDTIVKEIVKKKLYRNDEYLKKVSNFDYTKIDELTIDHIGFLFLENWNDKYEKMNDIIGKLSDQIVILQSYFPDEISKQKIVKSYIVHLMTFMPKCLSGLSLGKLEMYSEEDYLELRDNVSDYQEKNNDLISHILNNNMIVQEIDNDIKIKLLLELEAYQHLMIRKYNELIAYATNGGEIMMNELPDLLMCMVQNEYVMDVLKGG